MDRPPGALLSLRRRAGQEWHRSTARLEGAGPESEHSPRNRLPLARQSRPARWRRPLGVVSQARQAFERRLPMQMMTCVAETMATPARTSLATSSVKAIAMLRSLFTARALAVIRYAKIHGTKQRGIAGKAADEGCGYRNGQQDCAGPDDQG
jgi:hypothetical protein